MGLRTIGILQKKERGYLKRNYMYPSTRLDLNSDEDDDGDRSATYSLNLKPNDDGGRAAKSRIKTKISTIKGMEYSLRIIRADLWAIHLFRRLESDKGQKEWENTVLPEVREDLILLRDMIQKLIDCADDQEYLDNRELLNKELNHLWHGLDSQDSFNSSTDRIADIEEYKRRRAALYRILCRSGSIDILEYLYERERTFLPNQETDDGGQPWRKAATDLFVKELGIATKEERTNKYQITERGKAIGQTWLALKDCEMVETYRAGDEHIDIQKTVRILLERHFNTDVWTNVDFEEED